MIRIERTALSELASHIGESLQALRGHGVEIGGLVLGNSGNWSTDELVITGFVPVEIAFSPSPIFEASQAGFRAFEPAIVRANGKIIGCFRTQLHHGFTIRDEDRGLITRLFPAKDSCFVGIAVNPDMDNVLQVHRVPVGGVPALLENLTLEGVVATIDHTAAITPLPPPVSNVLAPSFGGMAAAPRAMSRNRVLWAGGGIAVAVALAIAYIAISASSPERTPLPQRAAEPVAAKDSNDGLKLRATQLGEIFEISWDPANPAVLNSAEGNLAVTGASPVTLSKAQLLLGNYFYKPAGNSPNHPDFSLNIYQTDGSKIMQGPIAADTGAARSQQLFNLPAADAPVAQTDTATNTPNSKPTADLKKNAPPTAPPPAHPAPVAVARQTLPPVHEDPPSQPVETSIATLREPPVIAVPVPAPAPKPVEPSAPAAPSVSLPVTAPPQPVPSTPSVSTPAPLVVGAVRPTLQPQMSSLIRTVAGHWTFTNQKARRPRITNGFQFAPEAVTVDVNPDGSGSVLYQAKPGMWHVADTSVQFQFRITDWDGHVLTGKSDGEKEYSLTLEPEKGNLNLLWHSLDHGHKLQVTNGGAALTRTPTSAAK